MRTIKLSLKRLRMRSNLSDGGDADKIGNVSFVRKFPDIRRTGIICMYNQSRHRN